MFEFFYKLVRWTLAGVFIYAGSIKLMAPRTFATLIGAYGIIPDSLLMIVAVMLPALEVAAGLGLLFDIEGSLEVIAGLIVLFIAMLGYAIWLGLDVDCGCFGPGDPEGDAFHGLRQSLYRDLVMLAGIVFMFGWRRHLSVRPVKATAIIQKFKRRTEENAFG